MPSVRGYSYWKEKLNNVPVILIFASDIWQTTSLSGVGQAVRRFPGHMFGILTYDMHNMYYSTPCSGVRRWTHKLSRYVWGTFILQYTTTWNVWKNQWLFQLGISKHHCSFLSSIYYTRMPQPTVMVSNFNYVASLICVHISMVFRKLVLFASDDIFGFHWVKFVNPFN